MGPLLEFLLTWLILAEVGVLLENQSKAHALEVLGRRLRLGVLRYASSHHPISTAHTSSLYYEKVPIIPPPHINEQVPVLF